MCGRHLHGVMVSLIRPSVTIHTPRAGSSQWALCTVGPVNSPHDDGDGDDDGDDALAHASQGAAGISGPKVLTVE